MSSKTIAAHDPTASAQPVIPGSRSASATTGTGDIAPPRLDGWARHDQRLTAAGRDLFDKVVSFGRQRLYQHVATIAAAATRTDARRDADTGGKHIRQYFLLFESVRFGCLSGVRY